MNLDLIRTQIPLTQECIYFNTGGIAPSLAPVTDTLVGEYNQIAHHGPPMIMDHQQHYARMDEARQKLAAFCHVATADLCLTQGVADGVTTVFNGIDWHVGDNLILTDEEHPAVKVPAERLAAAMGIELRYLPIAGQATEILQRLEAMITAKTRLLALSHVTTDTGTRLPAQSIVELAHARGVPVFYDGAQSLGQFPVDVTALGADFYSLLVYKWIYGPYTAGALYIEPSWQERLRVVPSSANYAGTEAARRFEFAPVPPPYYYATAAATDYIQQLGLAQIETQVRDLVVRLRSDLAAVPGLIIESPQDPDMSTGVIAFQVKGVEGAHISNELRARKIITRPTGLKFSGVRVSISFFNTQAELDALVNAVTEIVATDTR
jgi:selenocysteine lyase/cysteine desulfurase